MKEIIKDKLKRATWEDVFMFLFCTLLTGAIVFLGLVVISDHSVKGYYLATEPTQAGVAYQVKADIPYQEDPVAFSSPDPNSALNVYAILQNEIEESKKSNLIF